jgi:hypothetical protein
MNCLQVASLCTALGDLLTCHPGAEPMWAAAAMLQGLLFQTFSGVPLSQYNTCARTTVTIQNVQIPLSQYKRAHTAVTIKHVHIPLSQYKTCTYHCYNTKHAHIPLSQYTRCTHTAVTYRTCTRTTVTIQNTHTHTATQITSYQSCLTLNTAVVGTVRPLLHSHRHGHTMLYLFQKHLFCWECLSSSQRSITLLILSLCYELLCLNVSHSCSLQRLNDTAECFEVSDSVFETERKRLELCALCFPPDKLASSPPRYQ